MSSPHAARIRWAEIEAGVWDCVYCDTHPCECTDEDAIYDSWRDREFDEF